MPQIYYMPDERLIEVDEYEVILDASRRSGIPHTHICGGSARCSTCRVLIVEGLEYCTPRSSPEESLAKRLRLDPRIRLACQTQVIGTGKVTLRRLALDMEDVELINDHVAGKTSLGMLGQEKRIAIMFADIRGFTSFAETLLPYDTIYVLNRYFQQMSRVIERYNGTINNYMGDGLMALFGIENSDRAAEQAVRAGVEMLEAMEKLNPYFESLYHQRLQIGIGVHYGFAVVGALGSSTNQKMTAIGDAVNLASRIESANKQLGTNFLISEDTYIYAKDQAIVNRRFQVQLPGKSGEYSVYEVMGISGPPLELEEPQKKKKPTTLFQGLVIQIKQLYTRLSKLVKKIFGK